MNYQTILVNKTGEIAQLILNRAEKNNTLNNILVQELQEALTNIAADEKIRVLILQGSGKNFCAGGDIKWMQFISTDSSTDNQADAQALADLMYQLYYFSKPTIVLAQGATLGGGMGLLAVCDIVIADEQATFGFSEIKIGLTPSIISPYILVAIGKRATKYYFLTGDTFDVSEAHRLGLVHHISADNKLLDDGLDIANKLLSFSPAALITVKSLLHQVADEKITPQLSEITATHLAGLRATAEAQEGLKAFIEKRQPVWRQE